jgi:hypothetical protein
VQRAGRVLWFIWRKRLVATTSSGYTLEDEKNKNHERSETFVLQALRHFHDLGAG